ncbi:putative anaphase promoting complex subunit [Clavispora lusitaniae]|uniref:Anaphase-promoting complex subunit 5 n=1 Tax=Clavispora lusitaniae TaxID=36911 RepID=A0AA91Q373_CLALS|nr:putative anaphase promoting complex subunit [Clavispora lusitaniae]
MLGHPKLLITEELSPNRIALLFLIRLYLSDTLSCRSRILSILTHQLEGQPIIENNRINVTPTLKDLCQLFANDDSKGRSSSRNISASDVEAAQFRILDLFWNLNSVEDLHQLIIDSYSFLSDPLKISSTVFNLVSPRSIIGRFVQKISVAAKLLEFDESLLLFQSVCHYRKDSADLYESLLIKGYKSTGGTSADRESPSSPLFSTWNHCLKEKVSTIPKKDDQSDKKFFETMNLQLSNCIGLEPIASNEDSSAYTIAKQDLEFLVDTQVRLLEKFGTETPPELKSIMMYMAAPGSEYSNVQKTHFSHLPSYYFLQYLERLHAGDYHGAFDSLHQYFDYMVSKGSKHFYHFALISRASLHQYFGEDQKALDSIEEAISVARENKDNNTLTYVLSWLFNFMKQKPHLWNKQSLYKNSNESKLLDFLINKSQSVSLSLMAMSFRFEAEFLISSGGSFSSYYESLFKSLYISIHDQQITFINSCEMASSVWNEAGFPHLSDLYNEIGISYGGTNGPTIDLFSLHLQKQSYTLAKGAAEIAIKELNELKPLYSRNALQQRLLHSRLLISQIQMHLNKGRKSQALEILKMLPEDDFLDEESQFEKLRLTALTEAAYGNYSRGIVLLNKKMKSLLSDNYGSSPNILRLIRMNVLKAEILVQSASNSPGLSLFIHQFQLARNRGFELALAEGFVTFVSFLNSSEFFQDAYNIAAEVLPVVIRSGRQTLVSMLYYELARCCCGFIKSSDGCTSHQSSKESFMKFLTFLSKSISGFKNSSSLQMLRKCFELENEVTKLTDHFKDELKRSKPFEDFVKHSQSGIEILDKKVKEECSNMYIDV